jgi:hypothetical protein
MADAVTTITKLIQSPPGQLVAGGVLAGIVWKFFERVGGVLNEQTNREIGRWIRVKSFETGVVAEEAVNWPETFAKVFDRVFGKRHLTWFCFWRSAGTSLILAFISFGIMFQNVIGRVSLHSLIADVVLLAMFYPLLFVTNVIPDYLSLLETRKVLWLISRTRNTCLRIMLIVFDGAATIVIAAWGATIFAVVNSFIRQTHPFTWQHGLGVILSYPVLLVRNGKGFFGELLRTDEGLSLAYGMVLPAFFTSIWLWLYAGSGFILKAARRFDIGFEWFNRNFDIEKKPLQSIGLIAGAMVAVIYWAAVMVSRVWN